MPKESGDRMRKDDGKVRLDLIPSEWAFGLGEVLTMGANKYEPNLWKKGMAWSRCIGAALRHIYKWVSGEQNDPESGLHHLLHAAWNCLALYTYETKGLGDDDRNRVPD